MKKYRIHKTGERKKPHTFKPKNKGVSQSAEIKHLRRQYQLPHQLSNAQVLRYKQRIREDIVGGVDMI